MGSIKLKYTKKSTTTAPNISNKQSRKCWLNNDPGKTNKYPTNAQTEPPRDKNNNANNYINNYINCNINNEFDEENKNINEIGSAINYLVAFLSYECNNRNCNKMQPTSKLIEMDVMDQYRHTLSPIINENKWKNKGENTIVHLVIVVQKILINKPMRPPLSRLGTPRILSYVKVPLTQGKLGIYLNNINIYENEFESSDDEYYYGADTNDSGDDYYESDQNDDSDDGDYIFTEDMMVQHIYPMIQVVQVIQMMKWIIFIKMIILLVKMIIFIKNMFTGGYKKCNVIGIAASHGEPTQFSYGSGQGENHVS